MKYICALLLLFTVKSYAQYPFEKYPAIKYHTASFKIIEGKAEYSNIAIARYKNYRVELLEQRLEDSSNILVYHKNKLIKKINSDEFVSTYLTDPLYIGDFNNDGSLDFKIIVANVGAAGLASSRYSKTYLFNKGNDKFQYITFMDFFENKERDIGRNGSFEIIGQSLAEYKGHNYWLFDIYTYKDGKIINVSKKYNYPIAVPLLYKETFEVTHRIPKKELQNLSLKQPEFYYSY